MDGILYDVHGLGHVNLGQEAPGQGYEVTDFGGNLSVVDPAFFSVTPVGPVPEPATSALFMLGLGAVAFGSRRTWLARR